GSIRRSQPATKSAPAHARHFRTHPMAGRVRQGVTRGRRISAHSFGNAASRLITGEEESIMNSYLTVEQAADYMNTSVRFVRRLIAERRIPFHKIGRHV